MSKRWWQSKTIKRAGYTWVVAVAAVLINAYERGELTELDVGALFTATITFAGTIEGRKKAIEPIEGSEAEEKLNKEIQQKVDEKVIAYTSSITPTIPDLEAISKLPSAEDAPNINYSEELIPELSVDNEEEDLLDGVDLSSLTGTYYLVAKRNTLLKTTPTDSSSLESSDYLEVLEDENIYIDGWSFPKEKNSHIIVNIDEHKNINNGKFFVFAPHFKLFNVLGKEVEIESPTSDVPIIKKTLTSIKLPGYNSTFYLENPVYPGSHFTWSEALRNGQRMPYTSQQVDNIIAVAKVLDKIRAYFGNKPMIITSWLRPDKPVDINRQVGGARNSTHIHGYGVDWRIPSMNMFTVQEKMKEFSRQNNLGLGLGASKGFIHTDLRGYRVWTY